MLFQEVSALPDVMLFEENQSYYFIVPTRGKSWEDVESTAGGLCKTHNLKILIHVTKGKICNEQKRLSAIPSHVLHQN